ncbi:MAG: Hpt domain-containing protein [Acutalibacteraceae bacterium]|nr:Hpt domain-containing protein [Acutalibacteraceae bacterium]
MTLRDFYNEINGNYNEISSRILNEGRIRKYLDIFLQDNTFTDLCTEIDRNNIQSAYIYAHKLKGLSQNLSLSSLYVYADLITKALQGNNIKKTICVLPKLSQEYTRVISGIKSLNENQC